MSNYVETALNKYLSEMCTLKTKGVRCSAPQGVEFQKNCCPHRVADYLKSWLLEGKAEGILETLVNEKNEGDIETFLSQLEYHIYTREHFEKKEWEEIVKKLKMGVEEVVQGDVDQTVLDTDELISKHWARAKRRNDMERDNLKKVNKSRGNKYINLIPYIVLVLLLVKIIK